MNIKVQDVEVFFNNTQILKDVNIEVKDKEFVGIIGPNGSGKSTLLKCIYRNLKPSKGKIFIDNKELSQYSFKETAKKIAVVAQFNNYNFDFSVEEMVLMGRSPYKGFMERDNVNDYEIMQESLKKVGMLDNINRNFSSLSGGEKQRIILARALTQKTEGLILDEPTNHLDIKYQLQLMDIVKTLKITVLSAIHDLNIASMYCDKIYAMKAGKIIDFGTPKQILTKENIKYLYDVDAEVIEDKNTGLITIKYKPSYI